MKRSLTAVIAFLSLGLVVQEAEAGKIGTIYGDQIAVLNAPQSGAKSSAKLSYGEVVRIGDNPVNGFYQVKTSSGAVGWISKNSVLVGESEDKVPSTASAEELPPPPADNEMVPSLTEGGALPTPAPTDTPVPAEPAPPTAEAPATPIDSTPSMLGSPTLPHEDVEPGFPPPQKLNADQTPSSDTSTPPAAQPEPATATASSKLQSSQAISLTAFLGVDSVKMNEINQLLGSQVFQTATYFGGELALPMNGGFQALLRIEQISKSATVSSNNFSLQSMPVSVGLGYRVGDFGPLEVHGSVLLGVAFNTQLTETSTAIPPGNVTQFSTTSLMELLKADASFHLTRSFQLYGEAGYRFLKTSSLGANPAGTGDIVYQSTGFVPVPLDLSGPVLGAGIRYAF